MYENYKCEVMSTNPTVCCSVMYFCKRNKQLTNITIGRPASYIDLKKKDTEHHNIKMWIVSTHFRHGNKTNNCTKMYKIYLIAQCRVMGYLQFRQFC